MKINDKTTNVRFVRFAAKLTNLTQRPQVSGSSGFPLGNLTLTPFLTLGKELAYV